MTGWWSQSTELPCLPSSSSRRKILWHAYSLALAGCWQVSTAVCCSWPGLQASLVPVMQPTAWSEQILVWCCSQAHQQKLACVNRWHPGCHEQAWGALTPLISWSYLIVNFHCQRSCWRLQAHTDPFGGCGSKTADTSPCSCCKLMS